MTNTRKKQYGNSRSRKKKSGSFKVSTVVLAVIIVVGLIPISTSKTESSAHEGSAYCPDGIVDNLMEVVMPADIPSQLVNYQGYKLSFNKKMHIPNWVGWELTGAEASGKAPRYDKFMQDNSVEGCAETYDYLYSGYDRGHMAPAGDMKWSEDAMRESFYLTNICPQARELNTGAWRTLEEKCRRWAQIDSAIIIISGPILNPAPHEFIGDNRVAVPRSFFKVILSPYANPMRAIGFVMPNSRFEGGLQAAATSIDKIEELTGYDFFAALPDSIENRIESDADFHYWSKLKAARK